MYYKITNKHCKIYKELHKLRSKEHEFDKENLSSIESKTGLTFQQFLGHSSQQNFNRVKEYTGFKFTEPEKVDPKIWKRHKELQDIYVPNRATKLGREMADFLFRGLKGSRYSKVFEILNLEHPRRFTFPFVEIAGDVILLYLGDDQEPKSKDVIEITKREFTEINEKSRDNNSKNSIKNGKIKSTI